MDRRMKTRAAAFAMMLALAGIACESGPPTSPGGAITPFPKNCTELRALIMSMGGALEDSAYPLYANGSLTKQWFAFCSRMATATPREYLPINQEENYSELSFNGSVMRTRYSLVRIDPATFDIDALDTTGATTANVLTAAGRDHLPAGFAQFHRAGPVGSEPAASARIDLRGTPFRFAAIPSGTNFLCTNGPGGQLHLTSLNADGKRAAMTAFTLDSGSLVTTWAQLGCANNWSGYPSSMRWRLEYSGQ
jgi:hypothetical protein